MDVFATVFEFTAITQAPPTPSGNVLITITTPSGEVLIICNPAPKP